MSKDINKKNNKSRAIRRLVIWYKRNSAVTSIVDTATSSAATATNVAGNVVSGAGSVVNTASNRQVMLQEMLFQEPDQL